MNATISMTGGRGGPTPARVWMRKSQGRAARRGTKRRPVGRERGVHHVPRFARLGAPGSLTAGLAAHDAGWDMVTTAVVNGNTTAAGWASYLLDHAAQTPAAPSGKYVGVPGHVSHVTDQVRDIGGFPEDMRAGEDTVVNRTLTLAGKRSHLCTDAAFAHASPSTTVRHLVAHHFSNEAADSAESSKDNDPEPQCHN
jgi:hypothetical protein